MTRAQLAEHIFSKDSYLCVGLDTDLLKMPKHLQTARDGMLLFNKAIIDATKEHCVAYKINTAFYEAYGARGWEIMEETVNYIPDTHFKIADAKRGDIGNTSAQYAKAFFETLNFDAITVAPYMGEDSIKPFLEFKDKWTIVLGLTSNPGAVDFELQQIAGAPPSGITFEKSPEDPGSRESKCLYHHVLQTVSGWGSEENLMFVIGATNTDQFNGIRHLTPNHFFLVPGVGAQGGSLQQVSKMAMIRDCGLLVNASRAIIYASNGEDFAEAAATAAGDYAAEMKVFLQTYSR